MIMLTEQEQQRLHGFRFIDLFCGIGGFHLALSSLGAKCVFASDINKKACDVYERNFKIKPQGDITKIKCKDIPSHDILCAGFPCQPFSISGNKKGFEDKNGKLFFEIVRIARFHKPKVIFLENVSNLEAHNGGKTLETIKQKLKSIGYRTFSQVLNASNYDVPQARKRIYIIAFRNSLNIKSFTFPQTEQHFSCVNDILEQAVNPKYIINRNDIIINDTTVHERSQKLIRIGSVGPGRQGERIYSVQGQATTLSSQGGGPGGKTGIYKVGEITRILTPRECARVMGFPDSFILADSDFDAYTQFGNSVVVNVVQKIALTAADSLRKEDINECSIEQN